jgi:hypothetical protein
MAPRITEAQLRIVALRLLAEAPGGFLTTENLIAELEHVFELEGQDAKILDGRSDTYFSQKVRNLVSHRSSSSSLVKKGYAEYDKDKRGFTITEAGRNFLKTADD